MLEKAETILSNLRVKGKIWIVQFEQWKLQFVLKSHKLVKSAQTPVNFQDNVWVSCSSRWKMIKVGPFGWWGHSMGLGAQSQIARGRITFYINETTESLDYK